MYASETQRPALLRPREVCEQLQISPATFYRLVRSGDLPALMVGGQLRVDAAELDSYVYGNGGEGE